MNTPRVRPLHLMTLVLAASALSTSLAVAGDEEEEKRRKLAERRRDIDVVVLPRDKPPLPFPEPRPLAVIASPPALPKPPRRGSPFGPGGKFCRRCGGLYGKEGRDGCTC